MTEESTEISLQAPAVGDALDKEAERNLERYVALVWRIYLRRKAKPIDRNQPDS